MSLMFSKSPPLITTPLINKNMTFGQRNKSYYKFGRRRGFPLIQKTRLWVQSTPLIITPLKPPTINLDGGDDCPPHKRPPNEGHLLRGWGGGGITKGGISVRQFVTSDSPRSLRRIFRRAASLATWNAAE